MWWNFEDAVPFNKQNTSTTIFLVKINLASYDVKEISFANWRAQTKSKTKKLVLYFK
jgi:hypothetical protein